MIREVLKLFPQIHAFDIQSYFCRSDASSTFQYTRHKAEQYNACTLG